MAAVAAAIVSSWSRLPCHAARWLCVLLSPQARRTRQVQAATPQRDTAKHALQAVVAGFSASGSSDAFTASTITSSDGIVATSALIESDPRMDAGGEMRLQEISQLHLRKR